MVDTDIIVYCFECLSVITTPMLTMHASSIVIILVDPTFNKCNLEEVMTEVTEWKMLGYLIGDRNSQDKYERFQKKAGNVENLTQLMLLEWQELHPYASWTLLHQGLININELKFSQCIKDKYLSGTIIGS